MFRASASHMVPAHHLTDSVLMRLLQLLLLTCMTSHTNAPTLSTALDALDAVQRIIIVLGNSSNFKNFADFFLPERVNCYSSNFDDLSHACSWMRLQRLSIVIRSLAATQLAHIPVFALRFRMHDI